MKNQTINQFINTLSSKTPVPGGGGASALAGAIGMSLGSMVCSLTSGKKKYLDVQQDIENILSEATIIQNELLELIEKDAIAFEPLSKAYGLPKSTEEEAKHKELVMEEALKEAARIPFEIMETTIKAINLHNELKDKGSKIAISDVGVGVILCKSALQGASLNVYINTKIMKDREYANSLNEKTEKLLKDGICKADKIYAEVEAKLKW